MQIKCPNCNCEYTPGWNDDVSHCPMCGAGGIQTKTTAGTDYPK